jgi:hypothetical protein|tara:strand:- start:204 stop:455 length:252 start_codon:yes stop_codon:yes gene_type:complete
MFNNVEQKTIEILKKQHGLSCDIVEPMVKELALATANDYLQTAYEMFLENPSTTNYNYMISTMLVYQYWNQKQTKEFSITEDF